MDNDHNLLKLQDALGHELPETTQIFLHAPPKALQQLKRPIDQLKIKK